MYRREPPALLEAKARAFTALRAYREAGASDLDAWRLLLRVLEADAPTTEGGP